jgi:hypothetical protein
MMSLAQRNEVDRYLFSGDSDVWSAVWPGSSFVERERQGNAALRGALIAAVRERTSHVAASTLLEGIDLPTFARTKLSPLVCGLFPSVEREVVLGVMESSIVFLTPATIAAVLESTPWLTTAWKLANLYLASVDAELLSGDAPRILGLSEEITCYLSVEYFRTGNRFDDYVVHEAAHIFHNCKRATIGLPETHYREWVLDIDFAKRETFAYACEAYSRILELGATRQARSSLLDELEQEGTPPDERVGGDEYVDILREAIAARNGWKHIRERCSPAMRAHRHKTIAAS